MKKFWMLYAEGAGAPQHKHEDYLAALAEAKRIMSQASFKGSRVYVLEATAVIDMVVHKEMVMKEIKYD